MWYDMIWYHFIIHHLTFLTILSNPILTYSTLLLSLLQETTNTNKRIPYVSVEKRDKQRKTLAIFSEK